jgi:hypothetical protein
MSKAKAFQALDQFANSRAKLIKDMQAAGYTTVEECRPIVIEWACMKTGAEFRVAESSGAVKLVSSHPKYETAKTVVRDVMLMLEGTTRREQASSGARETDAVAKLAEKFAQLTKAEQKRFMRLAGL